MKNVLVSLMPARAADKKASATIKRINLALQGSASREFPARRPEPSTP